MRQSTSSSFASDSAATFHIVPVNQRPSSTSAGERWFRRAGGSRTVKSMLNAVDFFTAELAFRTDVSDVHAALHDPLGPGFVLVDSRGDAAWAQAHIGAAVHLPTVDIAKRAPLE